MNTKIINNVKTRYISNIIKQNVTSDYRYFYKNKLISDAHIQYDINMNLININSYCIQTGRT